MVTHGDELPNSAHLVRGDKQMHELDKISDNLARSRKSFEDMAEKHAGKQRSKSRRSGHSGHGTSILDEAKSPVTPLHLDDGKSGISRDPIFIKVEQRMQQKQKEMYSHIEKVEHNTADITTTTAALKNRTEELAQKQDEILK